MSRIFCGIVLLGLAFTAGCGGPSYGSPVAVTGKVTLDDKPVSDGYIVFHALEGLPAELRTVQADLQDDGSYELPKVYPAEYMVQIHSAAPLDATVSAEPPPNPFSQYGSESKLRAKVASDAKEFDFKLSSK